MKTPKQITVKFTEEDRRKAKDYFSNAHCLLSTALKRLGYKKVETGGLAVTIEAVRYGWPSGHWLNSPSSWLLGSKRRPFYAPQIVGLEVTLIRQ